MMGNSNFNLRTAAVALLLTCTAISAGAQDVRWLRQQIARLGGPGMHGRGYVNKGGERAAKHIARVYQQIGLQSLLPDSSYYQHYAFPVNTFPGEMYLRINRKELQPGVHYLINAASRGFEGHRMRIKTINLAKTDSLGWEKLKPSLSNPSRIYYLKNADSLCKKLSVHPRRFPRQLPRGCFIQPQHDKLVWTVATDTISATVFHVADSALPRWKRRADVAVRNVFVKQSKNRNVIGFVPGTAVPDSFIVFTAHYDHLGRMGRETYFPGACDNASGTAMLLYLARYFAAHPQRYSIAFIAFSGEEAGLLGSEYYTENPLFPLSSIRFVINIDMMGDASDGVTVVNATEHPSEFKLLQQLNEKKKYLPEIKSRGKSANSDHHPFSEKGVPAFFLYANKGAGFYHDIYDKPATITLERIQEAARLISEFAIALQDHRPEGP